MRLNRLNLQILFIVPILIGILARCEYDGPTAMYRQKQAQTTAPVIIALNPDREAVAGVNYITILGENFSENFGQNRIYFDNHPAEIVTNSTTAITVRRPNRSGDSITVNVVTYSALEIAKYGPYKIEPVYSTYGGFESGNQLSAVAVDSGENVYVVQSSPRNVYKIQPHGEKTTLGTVTRSVSDVTIGPGGKLILLMDYRRIYYMDVASGVQSEWVNVGKSVSSGDFDQYGNFYTGGPASDLIVVAPNLTYSATNFYSADTISCVRVYNEHVYLLVNLRNPDVNNPRVAIWRHQILNSNGNLGNKELVLNWAETGEYSGSMVNTFTFSADGTMYIGTGYAHPIISFNPQNGQQDIFYKGILPATAHRLFWGNADYLYMLVGGEKWDLMRIDMGAHGAPYYGRQL